MAAVRTENGETAKREWVSRDTESVEKFFGCHIMFERMIKLAVTYSAAVFAGKFFLSAGNHIARWSCNHSGFGSSCGAEDAAAS